MAAPTSSRWPPPPSRSIKEPTVSWGCASRRKGSSGGTPRVAARPRQHGPPVGSFRRDRRERVRKCGRHVRPPHRSDPRSIRRRHAAGGVEPIESEAPPARDSHGGGLANRRKGVAPIPSSTVTPAPRDTRSRCCRTPNAKRFGRYAARQRVDHDIPARVQLGRRPRARPVRQSGGFAFATSSAK